MGIGPDGTSPAGPFRRSTSALVLLLGTTVALGFSIGVLTPLIAARLEHAGVGTLVNGLTGTVMYLAVGLGSLLAGRMIPRWGARTVFLLGAGGLAASAAAFPVFDDLTSWFFLRGLSGGFAGLFFVATEVTVGLVGREDRRARNLAFYGVAFSVGFSSGAGLWPVLENLGHAGPFLVAASASAGALLLGPFLFPKVSAPPRSRHRIHRPPPKLGTPLVIGFSFGFCEAVYAALMPVYGTRVGYSEAAVGGFFVTVMVATLLSHIPVGMAADRLGPLRLTRACALLALVGVILPLVFLSTATLTTCCVLCGIGIGCLYTLGLAEVGRRVEVDDLANANAAYTASYGVGSVLGPLVGGIAMSFIGPHGFFLTLGACLIVLSIASFISREVPALRSSTVSAIYHQVPEIHFYDDWT